MQPMIPVLTTEQMREVDRAMMNDFDIALIQMMENAGRNLAELTRRYLGGSVRHKHVHVLSGTGGNGGGGLVAARHLSNWGAEVHVTLSRAVEQLGNTPARQWDALNSMPVTRNVYDASTPPDLSEADAILDAIIGYSLKGDPRGSAAELIELVNAAGKLTLSLDTPSGLDTTKGIPAKPCVKASATLTLALPKVGLTTAQAAEVIGELYLADISVPPALYAGPGLELAVGHIFEHETIVRLQSNGQLAER